MGVSERFACRVTGQNRTTQPRPPTPTTPADPDAALGDWRQAWAKDHPRRGFPNADHDARDEGWQVNHNKLQRRWREEACECRTSGWGRAKRTGNGGASSVIDRVNWQDAEPQTGAEHQRPPWQPRCWRAANRHDQAPRRPCMAAGATHGAAVRLLGYRQRMHSQLSPSRPGFQAPGMQRPRRSKARAPAPGRGPAVVAATRPDPTPGRVKAVPRPCGGLRPGRPAASTLPRRRVGENRRRGR
jgi:hypothetical protein